MPSSHWYLKFAIAAALLAGCDKKDNSASKPDDKPKTPATEAANNSDVAPKSPDTTPRSEPNPTPIKPTPDLPKSPAPITPAMSREQATKLLDDLKSAIDRGRLAEAETNLKQLDAMKDQLPRDLADRLETLRTAYKAWSAGGLR